MPLLSVRSGIDQLIQDGIPPNWGERIGLLTHAPACDSQFRPTLGLLLDHLGPKLKVVFTPEHGFDAHAQDLEPVGTESDRHRVRMVSLYGETVESLIPREEDLGTIDTLVVDLVDVGSRYYTFQATMHYAMRVASRLGLRVVILDRANPIGGDQIEGPLLQAGWESFVGAFPMVTRHGMTLGELARMFHGEERLQCPLEIIPCQGWERDFYLDQTTLPWVMPSPNMPTQETALVYPGQCLLEGTNLSEGRGTTRPFECFGAPWLKSETLADRLNDTCLPGVRFRPITFRPMFQKFQGIPCGGAQLHITEPRRFQPVRAGLAILEVVLALSGAPFRWRTETYEFVSDRLAIDLLFGSPRERLGLEAGHTAAALARDWEPEEEAFLEKRRKYLIYPE